MNASLAFRTNFNGLFRNGLPGIISMLALVIFMVPLFIYWNELTSCFRRQGTVIAITLFYWQVKTLLRSNYLVETIQFLVLFGLTERLNSIDEDNKVSCLDITNPFASIIDILYFCLYGYYIGAIVLFALLFLGAVLYDCYYNFVVLPRMINENSIRGKEFDKLERIEYSKSTEELSESQLSCSICLQDFQEKEIIIRLPVCHHYFHQKCIQIWLRNHKECPYCRADVKHNLKNWQNKEKNQRGFEPEQFQQAEIFGPQPRRNNIQNDDSVYIEMRDF